jgi:hypothetical protein
VSRLSRIARAYRKIARLEAALAEADEEAYREAIGMRMDFSGQSVRMVNGVLKGRSWSRSERKRLTRQLAQSR